MAVILWLWAKRDPGKCLLAMALTLMGWLAAVNTANDVMQAVVGSELFGTVQGAKASREMIGWILGGCSEAAVGAGLTAFGAGVPGEAIRRPQAWGLIVVVGHRVRASALSRRLGRSGRAAVRPLAGGGRGQHRLCSGPA